MGCWNKTCAISQFPLVAGDKTVNFVLVEDMSAYRTSTPCYPSDMGWKLIPIPFYGEYDDYGWQEDDDGQQPKYDFLAKHYKNEIVEVETEKERAKLCYPAMNGPFDSCESLGNSIHGNVWNLSNRWGDRPSRRMASFMVSRVVWDALTTKTLVDYPKRKWYTRQQLADAVDGCVKYTKGQQNSIETALPVETANPNRTKVIRAFMDGTCVDEYIKNNFNGNGYSDPRAGAVRFCGINIGLGASMDFAPQEPLLEGVITPEDVAAVYLMNSAMYSLRKGYHPQVGEGSQEGIDHTHSMLLKAMQAMVKFDKKRYA